MDEGGRRTNVLRTLETSQSATLPLNADPSTSNELNISAMLLALETFQLFRSWLKRAAFLNIPSNSVHWLTFHALMSLLNRSVLRNM